MKSALAVVLLAAGLTGCATRWVVDSDVSSYSSLAAVPPGATYRFERLPSQQAHEASQQRLEAMAGPALEGAGLRRDDANPGFTVQISARVNAELSPWAEPYPWGWGGGPWAPGLRYGAWRRGWYGGGWYGPMLPPVADTWYSREVGIVLRELPSQRVVYETHARNDGPYTASDAVLPVMFRAALQGFPNPPAGERRVGLEIPTAKN